MVRNAYLVGLALLAACGAGFPHESPFDPQTAAESQARASLNGSVRLEGETDHAQVTIELHNGERTYSVDTDAAGEANLPGIVPGTYVLSLRTRYFQPVTETVTVGIGGVVDLGRRELQARRSPVTGSALQRVTDGGDDRTTGGVTVRLRRQGSIRASAGTAPRLRLAATDVTGGTAVEYAAVSDANGAFQLPEVPAARYEIVAEAEEAAPVIVGRVDVTGEGPITVEPFLIERLSGYLDNPGGPDSVLYTQNDEVQLHVVGSNATRMRLGLSTTGKATDCDYGAERDFTATPSYTLPSEGAHTVCVLLIASDGREAAPILGTVVYDVTPPAVPYVQVNGGRAYTTSDQVGIQLNAVDGLSGVSGIRYWWNGNTTAAVTQTYTSGLVAPLPSTAEVTHSLSVEFIDRAGNVSDTAEAAIAYDAEGPQVDFFQVENNLGETITIAGETQVLLHLKASDTSPLAMQISTRADFAGAAWRPHDELSTWTFAAPSAPGGDSHTLYARVRDAAGREVYAGSWTVTIDTIAPAGVDMVLSPKPSVSSTLNVSLTAANADWVELSEDVAFLLPVRFAWQPVTAYTFVAEGTRTLYARFIDNAGNTSAVVADSVLIDTIAPTASVLINQGAAATVTNAVNLTLTAADAGSGVAGVKLADTEAGLAAAITLPYEATKVWTLGGDASTGADAVRSVWIQAVDAAGLASMPVSDTIRLDRAFDGAWTITLTGAEGRNDRTADGEVIVDLLVDTADVTEMQVSNSAAFGGAAWSPLLESFAWTLPAGDGVKEVFVRIRDEAGNTGTKSALIELDTTPPDPPALDIADLDGDSFAVAATEVELRWTSPAGSDLFELQRYIANIDADFTTIYAATSATAWRAPVTAPGNTHNYRVRAVDDLGNTSAWSAVADTVPYEPITTVTWRRKLDSVERYDFPPAKGTFQIKALYAWQTTGGASTLETVGDGAVFWERALAADDRINETLILKTENADGSLQYESRFALSTNLREPIAASQGIGVETPDIVIDGDGHLHLAWYQSDTGDLQYATRNNGVWEVTTIDAAGDVGQAPSIGVDSAGAIHISYYDLGNQNLKYATNETDTWVTVTLQPSADDIGSVSKLLVGDDDKVHIIYTNNSTGHFRHAGKPPGGGWSFFQYLSGFGLIRGIDADMGPDGLIDACITNQSSRWVYVLRQTETSWNYTSEYMLNYAQSCSVRASATSPSFWYSDGTGIYDELDNQIVSDAGTPFAHAIRGLQNFFVYYDAANQSLKLNHNMTTDRSTATSTLDYNGDVGSHPAAVVDEKGLMHMVYRDMTNNRLVYATHGFGKRASWREYVSSTGYVTSLAAGPAGAHTLVRGSSSKLELYSRSTSGIWRSEFLRTYSTLQTLDLEQDAHGDLHAAWVEYNGSAYELYYMNNTAGTWPAPTPVTSPSIYADLALDPNGVVHICEAYGGQVQYLTNATGSWSLPLFVMNTSVNDCAIAADASGKASIGTWNTYADNSGGPFNVVTNAPIRRWPTAVIDGDGVTHVFSATSGQIYDYWNGTFSILYDAQDTGVQFYVRAATDPSGKIHLAVSRDGTSLEYWTNALGDWESVTLETTDAAAGEIAVDDTGEVFITFRRSNALESHHGLRTNGNLRLLSVKQKEPF